MIKFVKYCFAFGVPIAATSLFLFTLFANRIEHLEYYKPITKSGDISSFNKQNSNEITIKKPLTMPNELSLELLNIPKELGQYQYCISHISFIKNLDSTPINTNDTLILKMESGSLMQVSNDAPLCFEEAVNLSIAGYMYDISTTKKEMHDWNLHNKITIKDNIKAYDNVSIEIKLKHPYLVFIIPFLGTAAWWGFLLLFNNIWKHFINIENERQIIIVNVKNRSNYLRSIKYRNIKR